MKFDYNMDDDDDEEFDTFASGEMLLKLLNIKVI